MQSFETDVFFIYLTQASHRFIYQKIQTVRDSIIIFDPYRLDSDRNQGELEQLG